jgi:hypothetical protein
MTSYGYIDALKQTLSSIDINLRLNDDLLLTYVNQARTDTQRLTMRLYPERYGDLFITTITPNTAIELNIGYNRISNSTVFSIPLPTDFIDIYECIFYWNLERQRYVQGRKVIKQELFTVLSHNWLNAQIESPIYCVENKTLYITGFDRQKTSVADTGTLLYLLETPYINLNIYYLKALDDLEKYVAGAPDIDTTIPETFQNIVVDIATIYALETMETPRESLEIMLKSKLKDIGINYDTTQLKKSILLPTKEL